MAYDDEEENLSQLNRVGVAGVTVGRVVHYVGGTREHRRVLAALVVSIDPDGYPNLLVHGYYLPDSVHERYQPSVVYCERYAVGCWSYPPRV